MAAPGISPERYAEAESLLASGVSFREAAEAIGTTPVTLYRKFPQYKKQRDPTPGGNRSQRKATAPPKVNAGPSDAQMVAFFAKAASAPAIPMQLFVGCDFCAQHFADRGPEVASKLIELSRDNPALRSMLEKIYGEWEKAAWGALIVTWFGVPLAHHMLPANMYWAGQMMLGLPPRETHAHAHAPAREGVRVTDDVPEASPYAGMDLEALLNVAGTMGIAPDPLDIADVMNGTHAEPPAEPAEPADAAEPAETAVTPAASDTD